MKKNKTILITGATSGIGKSLAENYAAQGVTLLLTGRHADRMAGVTQTCISKGAHVESATVNVTDQTAMAAQLLEWDTVHQIDLVIANAGISGGMGKEGGETESNFREIMDINLDGTLNTIFPLIPRMQRRQSGQIVLMGSMAGFRGLPSAPAYSVSKNAVRALAEALRPGLKEHGIKVNVICPGFIRTPLTDVNNFPMPFLLEPDEAAQRMIQGIKKDKPVIAFPLPMRMLVQFIACLPRFAGDWILSKAPKKP